jgi:cell division protein FtsI (penicillin-binding protein 3)
MTATPLQIANAYAAIANGGWLRQPYIVKAVRDRENGEINETKLHTIRRVLSDDHVAKMRIMLTGVTTDGSGINAQVPGYPVAGKTGTAQKVNPNGRGYLRGGYISSFGGFLPANDPRFVIYIAVDHPRKDYYGGSVAAPVFSRVAKFAVRRAGLAPVMLAQEHMVPKASRKVAASAEAAAALKKADEIAELEGAKEVQPIGATVPDLSGLTLREVLGRVSGTEVNVKVRGQGFVTHTSPPHGAMLTSSKELTVFLSR